MMNKLQKVVALRIGAAAALAASAACVGEVAAHAIAAGSGSHLGHPIFGRFYNPLDGLRWLATLDTRCVAQPWLAHLQHRTVHSCATHASAIAAINTRAGFWLGAALVPFIGLTIAAKQADLEKPGGRRLRRVAPAAGRLVMDIGAATGKLHAAGHLAGIRRGQRVCLVDDDVSQDTLILGGKGQGKTTSAMNPMLLQAMRQGAGALIFNVKGDYDRTVLAIAEKAGCLDRVRVIGIGDLAENVDILAGVTPEMAASYISAVLLLGDRGKDSQIWNTSAANLARAVLGLLWYFPARYSLPSLYRYLFVDGVAAEVDGEIAALEERIAAANAESADPTLIAATAKDLRTIRGCTQEIKNYNDQTHDIKRGIALQLTQLLSKMVIPEVEDAFFNHLPQYGPDFDLEQAYEDGTIFVINAPLQLYGLAAAAIMALIKLRFYVTMEQRRLREDADHTRRVGLFIDEFHEITTCSQEGLSDHKFLSTSRDTGTFCVFATQSIPSLTAKIGHDMTDALLANLRQRLYFRNEDTKTIEDALKLLGQTEVSRDTTSISRNKGSTTKGTSTQHAWQPVAHPELFRNLRRGEALFIGSIGGESADDIVMTTPVYV
jgi:hypothetical protein